MGRLQLVAIGCLVAGLWLLAVAVVHTDLIALAVAIVSLVFGIAQMRTPPGLDLRGLSDRLTVGKVRDRECAAVRAVLLDRCPLQRVGRCDPEGALSRFERSATSWAGLGQCAVALGMAVHAGTLAPQPVSVAASTTSGVRTVRSGDVRRYLQQCAAAMEAVEGD